MELSNNKLREIALHFDEAQYYSLAEASEYLNRKYSIDNISSNKLLKKIIQFEIPLYIYAKNFSLHGDYIMNSFHYVEPSTQNMVAFKECVKSLLEVNKKIYPKIDYMLSLTMESLGGLLRLQKDTSRLFLFNEAITTEDIYESNLFNGFIPLDNLESNSSNLSYLNNYLINSFNDSVFIVLALYPNIEVYPLEGEDIKDNINKAISVCRPEVINYCYIDNDKKVNLLPYFKISQNDLIILNKDLLKIEQIALDKEPANTSSNSDDIDFLKKKGVSSNKLLAKHLAKHMAINEWKSAQNSNLRIGDMAELIWHKLHKIGFQKELPDKPQNLRPWIKEVAPDHASEGGRPPAD